MRCYGVIMAGGGGTRFWPLSRQALPKQLLNLSGKGLMVNETIDRVAQAIPKKDILIVTNETQAEAMEKAVPQGILRENILAEPASRNTAACIGYAAVEILKKRGDGIMCVFPSDHYIREPKAFAGVLGQAIDCAGQGDRLVAIGITPKSPCTGYGYMKYEKSGRGHGRKVIEFKEKPDLKTAEAYVSSGEYVWNSGMFVWKVSAILENFKRFLPEAYGWLEKIGAAVGTEEEQAVLKEAYPQIPSVSIDYGIMEKSPDVYVVPGDFGWDDVGSWDNMGALHEADSRGNVACGNTLLMDTEGCIVYSGKKLVAALGVEDLIIVGTDDAVMVCRKDRAQDVKEIVDALKKRGRKEYL